MVLREELQGIIDAHKTLYESYSMQRYMPELRVEDKSFRLIESENNIITNPDQFTSVGYYAVSVMSDVLMQDLDTGLNLQAFVRGASSMALFVPNQSKKLSDLITSGLEMIQRYDKWPYISEDYIDYVMRNMKVALLNGETFNTYSILAYILGCWWVAGHIKDFDAVKVKDGFIRDNAPKWLDNTLTARAARALFDTEG